MRNPLKSVPGSPGVKLTLKKGAGNFPAPDEDGLHTTAAAVVVAAATAAAVIAVTAEENDDNDENDDPAVTAETVAHRWYLLKSYASLLTYYIVCAPGTVRDSGNPETGGVHQRAGGGIQW